VSVDSSVDFLAVNPQRERFEAKVDRTGDHHVWTGAKKADGTGQVRIGGRLMTAHRAAWEFEHGRLTERLD